MSQILPTVAELLGRIDWISAVLSGLCGAVVATFALGFARMFELQGWRGKFVCALIFAVSIMPVRSGAKTYLAPPIYEWTYEDKIVEEMAAAPFYKALLDHHPEARRPLVRAVIKVKFGRQEALVGATELGSLVSYYLSQDLPRTSDDAAKQFGNAVYGMFANMMMQDPGLCSDALFGAKSQRDTLRRQARLSPQMYERLGTLGGQVIVDAALQPLPPPDPARTEALQDQLLARLTTDGNPLVTDLGSLADDPKRACFAILQAFETAHKILAWEDFGPFLRATLVQLLAEDEI